MKNLTLLADEMKITFFMPKGEIYSNEGNDGFFWHSGQRENRNYIDDNK